MSMIDSLPEFKPQQNNSRLQEAKVSFQELLQDMEADYLSKQPRKMAETSKAAQETETEPEAIITPTEAELAQRISFIENKSNSITHYAISEILANFMSNKPQRVDESCLIKQYQMGITALVKEEISTAPSDSPTDQAKDIQRQQLLPERQIAEQGSLLQKNGLHVYLTPGGLGLSYRNAKQHTPSALEQVLAIKKLLAEQGKTVTEAYVNAQRIEFKGTENGY